jgi:hypothetical protein
VFLLFIRLIIPQAVVVLAAQWAWHDNRLRPHCITLLGLEYRRKPECAHMLLECYIYVPPNTDSVTSFLVCSDKFEVQLSL